MGLPCKDGEDTVDLRAIEKRKVHGGDQPLGQRPISVHISAILRHICTDDEFFCGSRNPSESSPKLQLKRNATLWLTHADTRNEAQHVFFWSFLPQPGDRTRNQTLDSSQDFPSHRTCIQELRQSYAELLE